MNTVNNKPIIDMVVDALSKGYKKPSYLKSSDSSIVVLELIEVQRNKAYAITDYSIDNNEPEKTKIYGYYFGSKYGKWKEYTLEEYFCQSDDIVIVQTFAAEEKDSKVRESVKAWHRLFNS